MVNQARVALGKAAEVAAFALDTVSEGAEIALELGMKALNDKLKKAVKSVTVVYDGKAPYVAACNIYEHIKTLGHPVKLIDPDKFKKGSFEISYGKVIIVGHHDLAKDYIKRVSTKFDNYGMKFGFSGNSCVLLVSRSELGWGHKGRKTFRIRYNDRIVNFEELANQHGTPMSFGIREHTRESQYDLLWLEFITHGLSNFLVFD